MAIEKGISECPEEYRFRYSGVKETIKTIYLVLKIRFFRMNEPEWGTKKHRCMKGFDSVAVAGV